MTTIRNLFALSILTLTMTFALACDAPEAIDVDAEDFRFLLPTVCASADGSDVFVSDFTCGADEWQVCEPGEYYAASAQRVCCPWGSEDGCRVTTGTLPCAAVESHVCDRNPLFDVHACSISSEDVYLQGPACDVGDIFLCAEGDFSGENGSVCCNANEECIRWADDNCPQGLAKLCSVK
jgi:hypothetical protein